MKTKLAAKWANTSKQQLVKAYEASKEAHSIAQNNLRVVEDHLKIAKQESKDLKVALDGAMKDFTNAHIMLDCLSISRIGHSLLSGEHYILALSERLALLASK